MNNILAVRLKESPESVPTLDKWYVVLAYSDVADADPVWLLAAYDELALRPIGWHRSEAFAEVQVVAQVAANLREQTQEVG